MLTRKRFLCIAALTPLLVTGCLERQFTEDEGRIETARGEIVVPCDMYAGRNLVKDTIFVSSNRSWSASIVEDGIDWMTIDAIGHQDMSGISEVTPLALTFLDNETEEPRTATVHVTCADGDMDITVTQEAITYRLDLLSSPSAFEDIHYEGDTLKLRINTNTSWSVKTDPSSTAQVLFSAKARETDATATLDSKYTGTIDVVVLENDDLYAKDASIIISAEGCDDITLPLSQIKGVPYVKVTGADAAGYTAEAGRPDCTIPVKSNIPWTAEILSCEGWEDGEVSVTASGAKGTTNLAVKFPYCIDFSTTGKIVVRFTGEGLEEPFDYVITQKPCIRIMWYDYLNAKLLGAYTATYPFSSPALSQIKTSASSVPASLKGVEIPFVTVRGGFTFVIFSTAGIWRNSGTGFMFGQAKGNYLKLPVVEGHRLVAMDYGFGCTRNSASTLTLQLQDPSGAMVEGGDVRIAAANIPGTFHFEFTGTANDTLYSLVNQGTVNFGIGDLILYYE